MTVLGAFPITAQRQKAMVDGARWYVPRAQLRSVIWARARLGDLFWVKEPYCHFSSRRFGPQNICESIPGHFMDLNVPPHIRPIRHQLRMTLHPASTLARGDSRATLEILEMDGIGLSVSVHMMNVDTLVAARRAVG